MIADVVGGIVFLAFAYFLLVLPARFADYSIRANPDRRLRIAVIGLSLVCLVLGQSFGKQPMVLQLVVLCGGSLILALYANRQQAFAARIPSNLEIERYGRQKVYYCFSAAVIGMLAVWASIIA